MRTQKSFDNAAGNVSWLFSPHGNYESLNPATRQREDLGVDNTGMPFYGFEGFGTDPACTTNCHDPLGEGLTLANNYAATGNDKIGRVNRPFIGCEACHGGGQNHFGVSSVPIPRPNALRCGRCHNDAFPDDHLKFHPEGDRVYEDYSASNHAKSMTGVSYVAGTKNIPATCSRCHTDEGAQTYISLANGTESFSGINTIMTGQQDIGNPSVVQCRTCHDKHNPNTLLGSKASGLPAAWSGEFKTCNSCHQLLRTDNTKNAASFHDPSVNTQEGKVDWIITDTHYDDPSTADIEGYIIDPASTHSPSQGNTNSGTCRDCHNPHNADTTINKQWANSAHGGFIATVKDAAGNGAVKDSTAPAWAHYDFKALTTPGASSDRRDCHRCHTATGFRNMANNPVGYDAGKNLFVASGNQKEMLYCWACHTSNEGNLRSPGQFVLPTSTNADGTKYSPYVIPPGRSIPNNLSGSFICLNCHSGRETGEYIKGSFTQADITGKNFGTFNSHYLAAGGILLRTVGYEYNGKDYANSDTFEHDLIGIVVEGTGSNGPCVGCHMKSSESHLFEAVKRDMNGLIIEIPALDAVCSKCHGVITDKMSVAALNNLDTGYNSALGVVQGLLSGKGISYNKATYPYFFKTADPSQQVSANAFTNWPNINTLGAAFNLNLLAHQPGAFAHNSAYTRRLLYDSIDFLDDGSLNDSVQTTLNGLPNDNPYKQAAIQFLLGPTGGRP
jgi:nitrate/TMAO reductase-like tetraheme cytochrome c subunit